MTVMTMLMMKAEGPSCTHTQEAACTCSLRKSNNTRRRTRLLRPRAVTSASYGSGPDEQRRVWLRKLGRSLPWMATPPGGGFRFGGGAGGCWWERSGAGTPQGHLWNAFCPERGEARESVPLTLGTPTGREGNHRAELIMFHLSILN